VPARPRWNYGRAKSTLVFFPAARLRMGRHGRHAREPRSSGGLRTGGNLEISKERLSVISARDGLRPAVPIAIVDAPERSRNARFAGLSSNLAGMVLQPAKAIVCGQGTEDGRVYPSKKTGLATSTLTRLWVSLPAGSAYDRDPGWEKKSACGPTGNWDYSLQCRTENGRETQPRSNSARRPRATRPVVAPEFSQV